MSTVLPYRPWSLVFSNMIRKVFLFCPGENHLYHVTCSQPVLCMSVCASVYLTKRLAWESEYPLSQQLFIFFLHALGEQGNIWNITKVFWWLAIYFTHLISGLINLLYFLFLRCNAKSTCTILLTCKKFIFAHFKYSSFCQKVINVLITSNHWPFLWRSCTISWTTLFLLFTFLPRIIIF